MKILFKQKNESNANASSLKSAGITQCYLKAISYKDRKNVVRASHHHTGYEIHIAISGEYTYQLEGEVIQLAAGELLLLRPFVKHFLIGESENAKKYALTFCISEDAPYLSKEIFPPYEQSKIPREIIECITAIENEGQSRAFLSDSVIENRILECIIRLARRFVNEPKKKEELYNETDTRVLLAKQYIKDNIRQAITTAEVADYCCISAKQLTRLFSAAGNLPVAEYIRQHRCTEIELLLAESELSLKEISEIMNFNNEYYFNSFFKKYSGLTPGAFRKSLREN